VPHVTDVIRSSTGAALMADTVNECNGDVSTSKPFDCDDAEAVI